MDVITANPKTAGVARWNFFALWGARMDKGEAAALDYVTKASLPPPNLRSESQSWQPRCSPDNADMGSAASGHAQIICLGRDEMGGVRAGV